MSLGLKGKFGRGKEALEAGENKVGAHSHNESEFFLSPSDGSAFFSLTLKVRAST